MYNRLGFTTVFPKALTIFIYLWSCTMTLRHVDWTGHQWLLGFYLWLQLVIGVYAYCMVFIVGPGSPGDFSELSVQDLEAAVGGYELPPEMLAQRSVTLKQDGRPRVCQTCRVWKPDRCHHCSSCNRCILKMDHHCPWFAECIGYKNHKLFINFLILNTFYAWNILFFTSRQLYLWYINKGYETELIELHLLLVWLMAFIFSLSLFVFTGHSIYQVLYNRTTIESYAYRRYKQELQIRRDLESNNSNTPLPTDNVFDLGSIGSNWKAVMGTTWAQWLLPTQLLDNSKGLYFPVANEYLLQDAALQDRLLRRVTPRSSRDINRYTE